MLTACSRPENLARVGESIANAAAGSLDVCWHVRFDLERQHVGGQALKNQMLDDIHDGWVYILDDDTVMTALLVDAVVASPWAEMIVVSQRRPGGRVLHAAAENMRVGSVDIGQAVIRRKLIGDRRIPATYEGDGVFLQELAAVGAVRYVDALMSFHNALEPVPA